MDKHMPKRESSFFSRTKIRFKELTEVPANGKIRPTKERKRAPRVPTAVEIYSGSEQPFSGDREKNKSQEPSWSVTSQPISNTAQSPNDHPANQVVPAAVVTPIPSPSLCLDKSLPLRWRGESTVESSSPIRKDKSEINIEEFFCLDPNPRMPLWNKAVIDMHAHWVNDRKRAGYTSEIELTDKSVSKEIRETLLINVTSFITAHLPNLFAVMHVNDQDYTGHHTLSFTMDTPSSTVLARVTGMEYSREEWDDKMATTDRRVDGRIYKLKNGEAVVDGFSCWGNRFCKSVQNIKVGEDTSIETKERVNVQLVNIKFRGIPMVFFVTCRDVHAGEYAYVQT